jgi:ATP-binding protein involved in chromosome partitioning
MTDKNTIMNALQQVMEPELHKDIVTLNMVEDVRIESGKVSLKVILTTPACPLRAQIERDVRSAVLSVAGVTDVVVEMDARVSGDGRNREMLALPIKHAIAIASGKGGVGKSTVSVNVAVSLAQAGARVGLLDADIYGPNIPTMVGAEFLPAPKDGRIYPAEAYGLKVMSIGFMVRPGQPLIWRGPMLHTAIRQFLADVEWGELDYLIIDLPPGTGDAQLSLVQNLPLSGGVIVTLPQKVSQEDAGRGLQMFVELKVPILGIVENMSYLAMPDGSKMDLFGSGGGAEMAQRYNVPLLGTVPIDAEVRIGGDTGKPVVISKPESAVAVALREIAEKTAARASVIAFEGRTEATNEKAM